MSFWLGVILKDRVVCMIDRFEIDLRATYIPIPWFLRIKERTKFLSLNNRCVFLPAGHVNTSYKLFELFKSYFGCAPFLLQDLVHFQWKFKKEAFLIWDPIKKKNEEDCRRFGYGVGGVDLLLVGIDRAQVPFLINISDDHKFEFHIYERPSNWFSLPQGLIIDEMVGNGIRAFVEKAMPMPEIEQREAAKRLLSQLFSQVKRKNKFISLRHDLIFIGANTEIWSSGLLFGRYRRFR